ncbi:MAG TPA: hypothetical protein VFF73_11980, partial [Planctomycetota bacterium]|nr:hypothetical protein [Planctomycetota bacterium]
PVIEELRAKTGLSTLEPGSGGMLQALGLASDPIDSWRKSFRFDVPVDITQNQHQNPDTAPLVELSFKSSDPTIAARVVNECAKRANDENNRFRRAFVEEVVRFIQKTQERAKEIAHKRDEAFNTFKLANMDKLPEQEAFIEGKLGNLRIRYADLKQTERFAEARLEQLEAERGLLVAQIALNVQLARAGSGAGDDGGKDTPRELKQDRQRLLTEVEQRQDAYDIARSRYTEAEPTTKGAKLLLDNAKDRLEEVETKLKHLGLLPGEMPATIAPVTTEDKGADYKPRKTHKLFEDPVKVGKNMVGNAPLAEGFGKKDEPSSKGSEDENNAEASGPTGLIAQAQVVAVLSSETIDEKVLQRSLDEMSYRLVVANPGYGRIRGIDFLVKETKASLEDLARQREDCFRETKKAEEQLAAIPEVRQRLESLARDLIESRDDYRRLTDQLDNARKALDVENENKGEQFRVIDFARPPTRPTGPGRPLLVALAVVLALGAAAASCAVSDLRARGVLTLFPAEPAPAAPRKEAA